MGNHHHKLTIREAYVQASSLLTQSLQQQAHTKHLQNKNSTTTKQLGQNTSVQSGHDPDAQSPDSAGVIGQDPQQVCEWLLLHLLDWDRAQLYLHFDEPFPQHKLTQWQEMMQRKLAGEPVQYIIGNQQFYGYEFQVNPAVLIPRPETELLVEAIVNQAHLIWPNGESLVAADIGTGSGAIAVTLALHMTSWTVHASDLSADALAVAMGNAAAHQVAARMNFYEGDLLAPFIERKLALDVLVSNPPYIPTADMTELQREVRDYEPELALHGGADGLDVYRKLIAQLAQLPQYPQLIGLEVGQGQAQQVKALLQACKQWSHVDIIPDLAGIERHVIGWRQ